MSKLTKAITAIALGLLIGISAFTSSAFAQSVNQNTTSHPTTITLTENQSGQVWQTDHGTTNKGWNDHANDGRNHVRHVRCVRAVKWFKEHHEWRRVVYQICHRY